MKSTSILPATLFTAFVLMLTGAYLKILHAGGADILLAAGLIATVVFIIMSLVEVFSSSKIEQHEKVMWTIALILGGTIAGLIYIFIGRKRVAARG
jgi:hypothetical protein